MMPGFRLFPLLALAFGLGACQAGESETREQLMRNYDPDVMPPSTGAEGGPVMIGLSLFLTMIQEVSDDLLKVDAWLHMGWRDPRLVNDFSGGLRLRQNSIWVPDMTVYNLVDVQQSGFEKPLAVVSNSGDVTVVDRITAMFPCAKKAGVRQCDLKLGSWTHNNHAVDLTLYRENIDLSSMATTTHFSISNTSAVRNVITYDCCPEPYSDATFHFTLTDKTAE